MSELMEEVVGDALTTVAIVPRWKLEPVDWPAVVAALRVLDQAIASGDPKQVHRASEALDALYPPTRLSAIPRGSGAEHRDPPPPEVMELVNMLIHPAGGWTAGTGATSDPNPVR